MSEPKEGDKMLIHHPDGSVTEAKLVFVSPGYAADIAKRRGAPCTCRLVWGKICPVHGDKSGEP